MPVSWTTIFRLVVMLLMATHVFYLYAFARTLQEMVGLDFFTVLASGSFALVMLVPLVWAVALPDLPCIIRNHLGRRRWLQGRCADCGYFLLQAKGGGTCPECGADRGEPVAFVLGWPTARRFAVLAVGAWLMGCVAAEGWATLDEATFAREAEIHLSSAAADQYTRPRRWPMHDKALYYSASDGVTAYSPELVLPEPASWPVRD